MKKPRTPGPEDRPLDAFAINGPEPWRTVQGVVFCHWDRWLLRLAITEPDGLDSIEQAFRRRIGGVSPLERDAEAMVAQLVDLRARLARVDRTAATLLDAEEIASRWLYQKAFTRVWKTGPHSFTEAMRQTPRVRLAARAMRGHWNGFPVSPAPIERALGALLPEGAWVDYSGASGVAMTMESSIESLLMAAETDDARLAVLRASVTWLIESMEKVDDSGGDMGALFEWLEPQWLGATVRAIEHDGVLRDLLEVTVWEDYGLIRSVDGLLRALPEVDRARAGAMLDEIIAELSREGLRVPLAKARLLRETIG